MIPANPVVKALNDLRYTIPHELLNLAFNNNESCLLNKTVSLDELIKNKVINDRVLIDTNIVGGEEVTIPMSGVQPRYTDGSSRVYYISKDRTRGRSIVSVLSLGPDTGWYNGIPPAMNYMDSNPLMNEAVKGFMASEGVGPYFNGKLSLVADNTILVLYYTEIIEPGYFRVLLENEENLNNIPPRAYNAFSQLVQLAVKSYIYNRLFIQMDQAQLVGGQSIGAMKEMLDNYSSAEEEYQTYLKETWAKVAIMADDESYRRFWIKSQINPFI